MMEQAHVVLHPLPVQGHIKPLLCLAKLLSEPGLYVTFLITHHTRNHLPNLSSLSTHFPNLHFESISDGLPDDHSREPSSEFFSRIKTKTKPHLKQFLLNSLGRKSMSSSPPVTCIITDEYLPYTREVAEELEIPTFAFVGHSASYLLAYLSVPKLIEQGHLPFLGENKNHEINGTTVPGLEGLLRPKNLPPFCLSNYIHHPLVQSHLDHIFGMNGSSGLIINTFEDLEVKSLRYVARHFSQNLHSWASSCIELEL
ncbi:7-deoxyloganetic acid glucosyltransferase [Ziziphus jujuba]|uniref:7-deoxyloganetic acid glucosyltransferase n=1 Tax=Ziziphus jujuba TaxID=326968 RepID=A0A6P4AWF2_ZIZJJ|nr:7-deoxyloganetic acid glucosyltransferase [Ziziphus jujuba]